MMMTKLLYSIHESVIFYYGFRTPVFLDPLPCNVWFSVKKGPFVARTYCRFSQGNKFAVVFEQAVTS
jgi:hypothetical protein